MAVPLRAIVAHPNADYSFGGAPIIDAVSAGVGMACASTLALQAISARLERKQVCWSV